MSSIFTILDIRIADQLDSGFGINRYPLGVAGSGSMGYCKEVKRTADRDLPLLSRSRPHRHRGLPGTAPAP
jgi:hypothetical protein